MCFYTYLHNRHVSSPVSSEPSPVPTTVTTITANALMLQPNLQPLMLPQQRPAARVLGCPEWGVDAAGVAESFVSDIVCVWGEREREVRRGADGEAKKKKKKKKNLFDLVLFFSASSNLREKEGIAKQNNNQIE